jgi:hypothetical protein
MGTALFYLLDFDIGKTNERILESRGNVNVVRMIEGHNLTGIELIFE